MHPFALNSARSGPTALLTVCLPSTLHAQASRSVGLTPKAAARHEPSQTEGALTLPAATATRDSTRKLQTEAAMPAHRDPAIPLVGVQLRELLFLEIIAQRQDSAACSNANPEIP